MKPSQQTLEDAGDIVCPAYIILPPMNVISGILHRIRPNRVHDVWSDVPQG